MSDTAMVQIEQIAAIRMLVPIVGTSPLIVNQFGKKARQQIFGGMVGHKTPKTAKNPEAEYEGAFYRIEDGRYGFPATGFKKATIGAARFYGKDVSMVGLRQYLFFRGEPGEEGQQLVPVEGEPRMREDPVTVGRGKRDLRYRPEFPIWRATLDVTYVASALTQGSVLSLIDAGGMGVGVGEWRPGRGGEFGTYRIDDTKEIEVIR